MDFKNKVGLVTGAGSGIGHRDRGREQRRISI